MRTRGGGLFCCRSAALGVYWRDRRRPSTLVGRGEHGKEVHREPPWGALWPVHPGGTVLRPVHQSQRDPEEVFLLEKDEKIKLISQMAANIYSGILSDPSCGFSDMHRNQAIEEAFCIVKTVNSLLTPQ